MGFTLKIPKKTTKTHLGGPCGGVTVNDAGAGSSGGVDGWSGSPMAKISLKISILLPIFGLFSKLVFLKTDFENEKV